MIIAFVLGTAFGATVVLLWCACAVNNKTRKNEDKDRCFRDSVKTRRL